MHNHFGNRAAVILAVVLSIGAAVIAGQGRSAQIAGKGQEAAIANSRIESLTAEIAASPIEAGKPALIVVGGAIVPAPSGTVLIQLNGQTAQAHSPAPGVRSTYDFLAKGNGALAKAKIEAKLTPTGNE